MGVTEAGAGSGNLRVSLVKERVPWKRFSSVLPSPLPSRPGWP